MKPAIKKRWLDALRSGKFRQAKSQLHPKSGGYCCLGVLCELARRDGIIKMKTDTDGDHLFAGHFSVLPAAVMKWAGLKDSDPLINERALSDYNDAGARFKTIARLIERHL